MLVLFWIFTPKESSQNITMVLKFFKFYAILERTIDILFFGRRVFFYTMVTISWRDLHCALKTCYIFWWLSDLTHRYNGITRHSPQRKWSQGLFRLYLCTKGCTVCKDYATTKWITDFVAILRLIHSEEAKTNRENDVTRRLLNDVSMYFPNTINVWWWQLPNILRFVYTFRQRHRFWERHVWSF